MRNLGGAIGIADVTTWLQDYGFIRGERFGEDLSHAYTSDVQHARLMLEGELAQIVTQQALTLAFRTSSS